MIHTSATFYGDTYFDDRIFSPRQFHRRTCVVFDDAFIKLGIEATTYVVITAFTLAFAWIIDTTLFANLDREAEPPRQPPTITRADQDSKAASVVNFPGSVRLAADTPDPLTFAARWARATALASIPADALPQLALPPVERASDTALLQAHPLGPAQSWAKPEIAPVSDSTLVAELTPDQASASARASTLALPPELTSERVNSALLPSPGQVTLGVSHFPVGQTSPQAATTTQLAAAPNADTRIMPRLAHNKSALFLNPDNRIAVYDISARTIYMPNGERLEAHSGLGNKLDDPRYVNVKDRGPTPPHVYDLALREQLFHGIPVIRLNPVGGGNMFGRDGMLVHPYMLSANGQSNGCVSIKNYSVFLSAYLRGEVDRLIVVSHKGNILWHTISARHGPARQYADNDP
jgi:hypothetical protein